MKFLFLNQVEFDDKNRFASIYIHRYSPPQKIILVPSLVRSHSAGKSVLPYRIT